MGKIEGKIRCEDGDRGLIHKETPVRSAFRNPKKLVGWGQFGGFSMGSVPGRIKPDTGKPDLVHLNPLPGAHSSRKVANQTISHPMSGDHAPQSTKSGWEYATNRLRVALMSAEKN